MMNARSQERLCTKKFETQIERIATMDIQQNPILGEASSTRARLSGIHIVLAMLVVFCLMEIVLVIVPFFAHGIHLVDPNHVYLSYYDPKSYFPYTLSELLLVTASLVHFLRPLTVPLIILTGVLIVRKRQQLDRRLLVAYMVVTGVTILILAFFTTSTGDLASVWLYD